MMDTANSFGREELAKTPSFVTPAMFLKGRQNDLHESQERSAVFPYTVRILAMTNDNFSQLLSYSLSEEQEKGRIISQYCHGDNHFYTCSHITVRITTCFSVPVSRFQPTTYPSVEHNYESLEIIVFLCLLKNLIHLC